MDWVLRDGRALYSCSTRKSIDANSTAGRLTFARGQLDGGIILDPEGMVTRKRGS